MLPPCLPCSHPSHLISSHLLSLTGPQSVDRKSLCLCQKEHLHGNVCAASTPPPPTFQERDNHRTFFIFLFFRGEGDETEHVSARRGTHASVINLRSCQMPYQSCYCTYLPFGGNLNHARLAPTHNTKHHSSNKRSTHGTAGANFLPHERGANKKRCAPCCSHTVLPQKNSPEDAEPAEGRRQIQPDPQPSGADVNNSQAKEAARLLAVTVNHEHN